MVYRCTKLLTGSDASSVVTVIGHHFGQEDAVRRQRHRLDLGWSLLAGGCEPHDRGSRGAERCASRGEDRNSEKRGKTSRLPVRKRLQ